mgnify:CR=1 FL=1
MFAGFRPLGDLAFAQPHRDEGFQRVDIRFGQDGQLVGVEDKIFADSNDAVLVHRDIFGIIIPEPVGNEEPQEGGFARVLFGACQHEALLVDIVFLQGAEHGAGQPLLEMVAERFAVVGPDKSRQLPNMVFAVPAGEFFKVFRYRVVSLYQVAPDENLLLLHGDLHPCLYEFYQQGVDV